jgi:hypothetical protein
MYLAVPAAVFACLVARNGDAEDAPADKPVGESELRKLVDDSVGWFSLRGGPNGETPLKSVPVLRWGNQERGSETGLTVLYVADGRPQAVLCVYPWDGQLIHEFSSLSEGHVRGELIVCPKSLRVASCASQEGCIPNAEEDARCPASGTRRT